MLHKLTPVAGTCGALQGLTGTLLYGWAMDLDQPDIRVAVEIYIDGTFVSLARADQPRFGDAVADKDDGFHAFVVDLRPQWLEGASQITARIANHGPWLQGARPIGESDKKADVTQQSQVWYTGGLLVTGWIWDPSDAQRCVNITAQENGKVVANATADRPHPALIAQDNAKHGFELSLPWELADGNAHVIDILDDAGKPLLGSPIAVCTETEGLERLLTKHWPGASDDPKLVLLRRLAAAQALRAPKTLGFEHYAEWQDARGPAPALRDGPARQWKAGILIHGTDPAASRTTDSLTRQRHPAHAVVHAEDNRLPQAIHRLLAEGADAIIPIRAGDTLPLHAIDILIDALAGNADTREQLGMRLEYSRGTGPENGDTAATADPAWLYADNDHLTEQGRRIAPCLKPAWDLDLFLGSDLVTFGAIWSASILRQVFALDTHPPAGNIDDIAAALVLCTVRSRAVVGHVPEVLYHSHAEPNASVRVASPGRQSAMQWLANELSPGATSQPNPLWPGLLQTYWRLPEEPHLPKVSVIVPTRDQVELLRTCVEGLLKKTDYPNIEIIVVDNDSACPLALEYLSGLRERGVTVLPYPHGFNYSAINNYAVGHASGDVLCLLNNDVEISDSQWLKAMVAQLIQDGVGIVGAKLLWPNKMVQHAGVVTGVNGLAAHIGNGWYSDDAGYLGFNHLTRKQLAVTAACLILRKQDFIHSKGFDEVRFPISFNDVDMCLRLSKWKTAVWSHIAVLTHAESATRGKDRTIEKIARAQREQQYFIQAHSTRQQTDCSYHPWLNRDSASMPYSGLQL